MLALKSVPVHKITICIILELMKHTKFLKYQLRGLYLTTYLSSLSKKNYEIFILI